jgi:putative endonuclease
MGIETLRDERTYYVYILASKPRGTLYVGVTGGLVNRMEAHRSGRNSGFTKRYSVHTLVYHERFGSVNEAIQREKTIKKWPRQWKINLIERDNPRWIDLYEEMNSSYPVHPIRVSQSAS